MMTHQLSPSKLSMKNGILSSDIIDEFGDLVGMPEFKPSDKSSNTEQKISYYSAEITEINNQTNKLF